MEGVKRVFALLVVSCFLGASPLMAASAADQSHAFPSALQGTWNPAPYDCKEAHDVEDDMRFEIAGPLRGNFEDIETISSVAQVADSPDAWHVVTISNVIGSGDSSTASNTAISLKAPARKMPNCCALGCRAIGRLLAAYFASVLDEHRNAVDPWDSIPDGWRTYLTHDFGSSAPSATYIVAVSPGETGPDGRWYPRDSLILVDELATHRRDNVEQA